MSNIMPFERYTARYEKWFEDNVPVYSSELDALRVNMPSFSRGIEVGVGSGRFAAPLNIYLGMDPASSMLDISRKRGIEVVRGVAEKLPFADSSFDLVLMVTTICFLDDIASAFREVNRILMPGGSFVMGFIDKNSPVGRSYQEKKANNIFYNLATFYSVEDAVSLLNASGFDDLFFTQTIFRDLKGIKDLEPVLHCHGQGSFVVIRAVK
ncbi:methyltransferase type 11 [Methanococcoides methylutens]|uniref:Methyltransferase type 11 n=2 Tax=Methanococcoides methylutens TaxID=2226 RepID=A0A099SYQ3_METMT|nr:class I SAM-dependent methyltransferase [Methanococcoides methylutens]KGK97799.1 methyltransferase type 11 [Methanococcoides methylutens]